MPPKKSGKLKDTLRVIKVSTTQLKTDKDVAVRFDIMDLLFFSERRLNYDKA